MGEMVIGDDLGDGDDGDDGGDDGDGGDGGDFGDGDGGLSLTLSPLTSRFSIPGLP